MFLSILPLLGVTGVSLQTSLLAQVPVPVEPGLPPISAEHAALMFSGPQFFTALISGVLLAFGFQLLLTNLGVATWFSWMGKSSSSRSVRADSTSDNFGDSVRKVSFYVGMGTLVTVSIVLFFASICALKLSLLVSPLSGAIVGLVIWATYFSLLVWFGSTKIGSLVGSIVSTATSGFQAILGTASAVMGGKALDRQVVNTAEAAAAAVRRELSAGLDSLSLKENIQDYLETLRPRELEWSKIRSDFESLLNDPSLHEAASSDSLQHINRQTFVDLIGSRSDLSKREVNRLADQLDSVWQSSVKRSAKKPDAFGELVNYLKSATRDQLAGNDLTQKIDALVGELSNRSKSEPSGGAGLSQAMAMGFNTLISLVLGRTDLSDLDVEKITDRLNTLKDRLGEQAGKITGQAPAGRPFSPIAADIENYLHNASPWQLNREALSREFRELLYDPEADPGAIQHELEQIDRSYFVNLLQQKGILTQERIQSIADQLEEIRLECLRAAEAAQERKRKLVLMGNVEYYLSASPKEELVPDKIQTFFKPILADPSLDYERLSDRLSQFDRPTFERILGRRSDIAPEEMAYYVNALELARNQVLGEAKDRQAEQQAKVEEEWLRVQTYLRDTEKAKLTPDAIASDLDSLLRDRIAEGAPSKLRASYFDRYALLQVLHQRRDLSEEEMSQLIDRIETVWNQIYEKPPQLADRAKEQYDTFTAAIADYLRNTGKEELNPEGIQRDLNTLLHDPKIGAQAIRDRLARMDRDTIVKLVGQRSDLTEAQVDRLIDNVQESIRLFAKAPRRLARRTQETVQNFPQAIADYLRSTDKEELNPEGIRRDIQILLNDPRHGIENLKDRLSHFDRDTLVALLSQREDISQQDVERIIDQILIVREQFLEQLQSVQYRIQKTIDNLFAQIRNYLNSLDRPELNYDGIKRDLQTVFEDPQAGFEALRDRFSHIDRDTLVSLLSSREDISQADAERIIDQIERSRDRILHRAERLQQQAQRQLELVKIEAQQRMEETRQAAATASWWLFAIALVSALFAAGGGILGVLLV